MSVIREGEDLIMQLRYNNGVRFVHFLSALGCICFITHDISVVMYSTFCVVHYVCFLVNTFK